MSQDFRKSRDLKIISGQKTDSPVQVSHQLPNVATINAITEDGALMLHAEGFGSFRARTTGTVAAHPKDFLLGRQALVTFEAGNPEKAIAVDVLMPISESSPSSSDELQANVDGDTISLKAKEKIELKCGKGSISIDKRGHIRIRGTHLLSRSSGAVRIKGGNVSVN